jgi:hypothetical protein
MFTNHGKEDGIYPLKRVSKAQNKDQRSIVTTYKNTYKGLWRLLATHVAVMMFKVILCQSFHKCISNLFFCVNRENPDKPLSHTIAKMMIANIYVLGPWR